ncbi:hypothetical protein A2673_01950 [Candidatus Kaiserbacteria bacterium RIFCSPHIGHO2_01_FULL_50_13]|uniref:Uncharacterized protein n=1 Tax=Candidatus Kaiserbacteria bacterium RIFCSPLOWO2_01_FULL_50_24 TaxID=1798507 RepID=A0A1F6ER43_9BACT|nr:MAG: hypothetical protein A2673_01950 [Candidatus Kaiserbacteria bacterium RIFCSPHIGHO2_01_FULL_50_13]OGG76085.1 MAG: hypothetical protein A3A34_00595 [Candidatus Kaiserbacteria bacterium RIFCSPLOWO2_01_FULL_50_24]OGG81712.1 MAG: hypothetical protein A3H74_02895 [Candidatus Kaiserbacteria bacterium RIFCSPLOWO2_02_FULL_51_13]
MVSGSASRIAIFICGDITMWNRCGGMVGAKRQNLPSGNGRALEGARTMVPEKHCQASVLLTFLWSDILLKGKPREGFLIRRIHF